MRRAVTLATAAGAAGEVPVAAIITDPDGQIIAEAVNAMQETG
ncbi:MAG: nucleoside deaminase, partial [Proteobacteria bacterium]|nr:nucleoside deaminase [Pseudomonadota bacterium]